MPCDLSKNVFSDRALPRSLQTWPERSSQRWWHLVASPNTDPKGGPIRPEKSAWVQSLGQRLGPKFGSKVWVKSLGQEFGSKLGSKLTKGQLLSFPTSPPKIVVSSVPPYFTSVALAGSAAQQAQNMMTWGHPKATKTVDPNPQPTCWKIESCAPSWKMKTLPDWTWKFQARKAISIEF